MAKLSVVVGAPLNIKKALNGMFNALMKGQNFNIFFN
tara:strand:+ start:24546 stop:24656 length:111 start_codon:yes stop_codon:yes gene_type:complete